MTLLSFLGKGIGMMAATGALMFGGFAHSGDQNSDHQGPPRMEQGSQEYEDGTSTRPEWRLASGTPREWHEGTSSEGRPPMGRRGTSTPWHMSSSTDEHRGPRMGTSTDWHTGSTTGEHDRPRMGSSTERWMASTTEQAKTVRAWWDFFRKNDETVNASSTEGTDGKPSIGSKPWWKFWGN